ncbi:MAG: hypothetical protein ACD_48C00690G0005 [uncultured bacterium]|nr:MAG: hypothetical protein ACD_48C00690G0005 [uncultured bacterium]
MKNKNNTPTVLIILDGWGISEQTEGNAIRLAKIPFFDLLSRNYPNSKIQTCCEHVGMPKDVMGNSEVGHMNMGAGRVCIQDITKIRKSIKSGAFFHNPALLSATNHIKQNNSKLHIVGLISNGLVHSDIDFLYALLELAKREKITKVYIHAITDGIDVPSRSALRYIKNIKENIKKYGVGQLVTVGGRYYVMDRAHNYERTAKAYHAMVHGIGPYEKTSEDAVMRAYDYNLTDDMIEPTVLSDSYIPKAIVEKGDAFIFFNLRSDRTRQLSKPFVLKKFDFFDRGPLVKNLFFVGMTNFGDDLPMSIAFLEDRIINNLPEYLGTQDLHQLYIAEEEKFAPVAYFFHGGTSVQQKNEKRIMIRSPKVKSYDRIPEMSAEEVTQELLRDLSGDKSQFITVNFANPDMLGHTGNLKATIRALEFLDSKLEQIVSLVLQKSGTTIITADHGNCEEMTDPKTKKVQRTHTTNPVPFILVNDKMRNIKLADGILGDIAPTILKIMGIEKPKEMTGKELF